MFKKIVFSIILLFGFTFLNACGEKITKEEYEEILAELEALKGLNRTYPADGYFTAFQPSISSNLPEIITVSVRIQNDKIVEFYIDTLQSTKIVEGENVSFKYNWKTKKQLGYEYYMFPQSGRMENGELDVEGYIEWLRVNNKKEWFEQAKILEQFMLNEGIEKVEIDENNKTTNVTGVTISVKTYVDLAEEAVNLAKAGKLQAVSGYDSGDIVWATADINRFKTITNFKLDVLQGKYQNATFVFNEKSKQELGYEYYMFPQSGKKVDGVLDVEGYKEWLKSNNKKEWFEQAYLICQEFAENGSYNFVIKSDGKIDNKLITGVTISDSGYLKVLNQLLANAK
ncbi:MAG: hypothetical protein PHG08_03200 [Bacilli bacterium]|nr:hypothetical protein [Bacilli bacterium]